LFCFFRISFCPTSHAGGQRKRIKEKLEQELSERFEKYHLTLDAMTETISIDKKKLKKNHFHSFFKKFIFCGGFF
jgi:hypothetical protein